MKCALFVVAALGVVGCAPKGDSNQSAATSVTAKAAPAAGGGSSDTIRPIGPNVGPMTPVAGGENLSGGSGGGVGNVAKDQARKAAGMAGSVAGMGDDAGQ
ncbi:MAG TPA: hypothetical protein VG944_00840 [Fimbriimonas sp.]|nr:hypothetical protein [Fimbriimonas sp.]